MSELNDNLMQSLHALQQLRSEVSHVFEQLSKGVKAAEKSPPDQQQQNKTSSTNSSNNDSSSSQSKLFLTDLQKSLLDVNKHFSDFEKHSNALTPLGNNLISANSYLISQDPILDRTPLFTQLLQSYKWWNKAHDVASHTALLLGQNSLKRSMQSMYGNKRMRKQAVSHSVPTQLVDTMIGTLDRLFPDMSISVSRSMGSSAVMTVSIGRTMVANIVLRGFIIESVNVKANGENAQYESAKDALWSKSKYVVFQKVTDHTNAAMLHFYSPLIPELAIRSFMTWLHSYTSLFSTPCHKCGKYLLDNLPPTWRDFRSLDAFHDSCRQQ
ncbi:mediator of RNA polymerase II transcription subunit 27-like [Tubulanus polymorphus]|uniref:mediator of RNA polymerase II transcription subunit 27-like n=1 Tax=Tubulanus polymorphus TaxID=672921 RepID=UPI003DA32A43